MGFVYAIVHSASKRKYIGSTVNRKQREKQHFSDLRKGRHFNPYLQRTFNKYGEGQFSFEILEECADVELAEREKQWIASQRSCERQFGFNITDEPYAPMRGKKWSQATRDKMAVSIRRGKKHHNAKYTEKQVRRVFELYQDGISQLAIEKETGIDATNISLMLRGRAWSHLRLSVSTNRTNNKSGCVGVYFVTKTGKWKAEIIRDGKYCNLGYYSNLEDAIIARKKAEGVCHRV